MLTKILLLALVVIVVWYGYKILDRRGLSGIFGQKEQRRPPNPARPKALDMQKCGRCGDYVAADAQACARNDCPYPAA